MDIKIVEKVQKLLALSESSNENEAQCAMLKAQELLFKHKLSIKEVKEFKINNSSTIKEKVSAVTFTQANWKGKLAKVIADNYGCYLYFKTRRNHTITFFGREEDALICNIVLEYAIDCIKSMVKRIRYIYTKKGLSVRGLENDYAIGFIRGMKDKFEEQRKNNKVWGLVLVKDAEVIKAYENIEFKKTVKVTTAIQRDRWIYSKGYEQGNNFSVTNKIAAPETPDQETKEGEMIC